MKKIFLLIIALCVVVALAACNSETGETNSQNSETVSATQSEADGERKKMFGRTEQIPRILTFPKQKKTAVRTFPKKMQARF